MSARWGKGITPEQWRIALRWKVAEETGWPLEYIDRLTPGDIHEYLSVKDARFKVEAAAAKKARRPRRKRRRR